MDFTAVVALDPGSCDFEKAPVDLLIHLSSAFWEQDHHGIRTSQRTAGFE